MKINTVCKTPDPEGRRKVLQGIYNKYGTIRRVSVVLKVQPKTVCTWFKKYGVKVSNKGRADNDTIPWKDMADYCGHLSVYDMLRTYADYYSITDASTELGISNTSLSKKMRRYNIKKPYVHTKAYTLRRWTQDRSEISKTGPRLR